MGKLAKKIIPEQIRNIINKNYFRIKYTYRLFFYSKMGRPIDVLGNQMYLQNKNWLSEQLLKSRMYEEIETEFVLRTIQKDDIVLDLGANIGYYTLLFAKMVGEKGSVFSFEPGINNFKLLKKNVQKNDFKNIHLEKKAISNFNGKTKLFLNEKNAGANRIYHSKFAGNKYEEIEVITLDIFFKKMENSHKVNFIKLDIEGAELAALKGMENLLEQNKSLKLLMEFDPKQIQAFGSDPQEIIEFLKNKHFKLFTLNKKNSGENNLNLEPFDFRKWDSTLAVNLICIK